MPVMKAQLGAVTVSAVPDELDCPTLALIAACPSSADLQPPCFRYHLERLLQLGRGAELDDVSPGVERRHVSRGRVVRVTGPRELFVSVREGEF
jgi:hypothetical protein